LASGKGFGGFHGGSGDEFSRRDALRTSRSKDGSSAVASERDRNICHEKTPFEFACCARAAKSQNPLFHPSKALYYQGALKRQNVTRKGGEIFRLADTRG
jgi:hypothetical protein